MKVLQKMFLILIVILCIFNIVPHNIVRATTLNEDIDNFKAEDPGNDVDVSKLQEVAGKFLGFLRIISGLIVIILSAFTGIHYIVATPEVRGDLQKRMLPIIIGLILVFGAVSVTTFFFSGSNTNFASQDIRE